MLRRRRLFTGAGCVAVLLAALASSAAGSELRAGGRAVLVGLALPSPAGSAEIDLFVGLGSLEASSRTELSLFPYTTSSQTVALSLARDWLSLSAEYQFSIRPLGITAARILARAGPPARLAVWGNCLVDAGVESEARLVGYGFATTPLRAEFWVKGTAGVGGAVGPLDVVRIAAAIEGTLSAPDGTVVPKPSLVVSASLGRATLSIETELSFAGGIRIAAETVSLACSRLEWGLSAKGWCAFSGEPTGPSAGLRISYAFGAMPRCPFPGSAGCVGGVCY